MSALRAAIAEGPSTAAGASPIEALTATEASLRPTRTAEGAQVATCPRCAQAFACGASAASCWCQSLPAMDLSRRPPDLAGRGCLCGGCLGVLVAEQLAA
jgi:hypothetical protein